MAVNQVTFKNQTPLLPVDRPRREVYLVEHTETDVWNNNSFCVDGRGMSFEAGGDGPSIKEKSHGEEERQSDVVSDSNPRRTTKSASSQRGSSYSRRLPDSHNGSHIVSLLPFTYTFHMGCEGFALSLGRLWVGPATI